MDRITRRLNNGIIEFVDGKGYGNLSHDQGVKLLFERLAAYEDTLLSPEKIGKLQSRLDAKYTFISNGMEEAQYVLQESVIAKDAKIELLQKENEELKSDRDRMNAIRIGCKEAGLWGKDLKDFREGNTDAKQI